jgi:TolA-binding protein
MKKKVSPVWTGGVISLGIASFGTVLALCVAPPLAIPIGVKLGAGVVGLIGFAFSAGDTAVNHFSSCGDEQKEEPTAQEGTNNDGNSADIRQLSSHVQSLIQKVDEIEHHQNTIERRQNTMEMQREKDKKEQSAVRKDVDSNSRRISTLERKTTSHVNKASTASSSTSSSPQTSQEQTDTIPENVSTLLSKHGLHSLNQSEYSSPSDASSVSKRRTPTNLRI